MVASAVEIPVIADADDGYGNALSTIRTVQEYVRSGVAGHSHRRPGVPQALRSYIAGKVIVSQDEAVGKYRAAVDTRNTLNPDFVIIARTDAFGAVGGSLEEAIKRGRAYADAGVDLVWPELSSPGPRSRRGLRQGHARDASERAAGLQLLLVVQVAQGSEPVHLPRAR
jgi:2-methylisocitrate lyase-like PEP mutase family enzyme